MNAVDTLRRAATHLRERAVEVGPDFQREVAMVGLRGETLPYVAVVDPPVGLAVADLLDYAVRAELVREQAGLLRRGFIDKSLAVARAILGEEQVSTG